MEILDTCHCHFESFCHFFIYIMGLEQKFRIWTIMFGAQFGFVNEKKINTITKRLVVQCADRLTSSNRSVAL